MIEAWDMATTPKGQGEDSQSGNEGKLIHQKRVEFWAESREGMGLV